MNRAPPTLDLRPDGSFAPPPRLGLPLSTKIMLGAFAVAIVAGSLAIAAVAVWFLSLLLPVIAAAALLGIAMAKFRRWQGRRAGVPRRV